MSICDKCDHGPIIDGPPRATKWRDIHSHQGRIQEYRWMIYALVVNDFIWSPYVDRRVHREFDDTTLFQVICDGRVHCLDIYLRGSCVIWTCSGHS